MTSEQLLTLTHWFQDFTQHYAQAGELHTLLKLKVKHTQRVARDARDIASDLGWPQEHVRAGEALGWLHDIGRFPQFQRYQTFNDAKSFNHGSRAWAITKKQGWVNGLPEVERDGILQGILWHNAKDIPSDITDDIRPWVQLIRDADKLDIFNVVAKEIKADGFKSLSQMYPHVKLDGPVNPVIIENFRHGRTSSYQQIQTLNDFLLIQLAWVYDIHFAPTFKRILDRDILAYLIERLPQADPTIHELVEQAEQYVLSRV